MIEKIHVLSILQSFYTDKFGVGHVEIIKDSNTVERHKLAPDKAYIQLTYVEPHFDLYQIRDRVSFFDKNYHLSKSHLIVLPQVILIWNNLAQTSAYM